MTQLTGTILYFNDLNLKSLHPTPYSKKINQKNFYVLFKFAKPFFFKRSPSLIHIRYGNLCKQNHVQHFGFSFLYATDNKISYTEPLF